MTDGYTANLPVEEASDPGFFARVLPSLSGVVELVELVVPDRPTGETLIGAAIADLSRGGSFRERWGEIFDFRDAGAEWGLVALDQQVSADPLLGAVESAIASTPLTFRSEERRVGKECVGTCRYRWSQENYKKKKQEK